MSKAVSVLIFMEDYTFDLHPTDLGVLLNQNNMCISKSQRADWEAGGGGGFFFLPGSGIFLVKYFPMLTETSPPTISLLSLCCYFKNTLFFSHVSGIDETPQWLLCWNAKKCVTYSLCEEIRIGKSVSSFTKQALPQGQVFLSNY